MSSEAIKSLVLAIIGALLFAAGWAVEGWRMGSVVATLKSQHAEAGRKAAEDNARVLTQAIARGDRLTERLAAAEAARDQLKEEKDDAIRRLTVGRRCLDGAAVRVLNSAMPAGLKLGHAPKAAGQPVPADVAFATDTDVGLWINGARRSYDTCRGRLQAIADFYGTTSSAVTSGTNPTAQTQVLPLAAATSSPPLSPAAPTEAGDSARCGAACGN